MRLKKRIRIVQWESSHTLRRAFRKNGPVRQGRPRGGGRWRRERRTGGRHKRAARETRNFIPHRRGNSSPGMERSLTPNAMITRIGTLASIPKRGLAAARRTFTARYGWSWARPSKEGCQGTYGFPAGGGVFADTPWPCPPGNRVNV